MRLTMRCSRTRPAVTPAATAPAAFAHHAAQRSRQPGVSLSLGSLGAFGRVF